MEEGSLERGVEGATVGKRKGGEGIVAAAAGKRGKIEGDAGGKGMANSKEKRGTQRERRKGRRDKWERDGKGLFVEEERVVVEEWAGQK